MNPFVLLASADHHFDAHGPRWSECLRIHGWMVEEARRTKPDVFVSAGDIYERDSTPEERSAVAAWLRAMAEICPVVIARGNHDKKGDLALLAKLRTVHPIHVFETCGVVRVGGAAIAVVPWPSRATLAAHLPAGTSGDELDAITTEELGHVMQALGDELAAHDGPRVLAGHWAITGAMTSLGQPLRGGGMNIGLADLGRARADIAIAGHTHLPQDWVFDGRPIVMCGSSFRTAYGEAEEKSIVRARWERGAFAGWERVRTPARPMHLLTGAWVDGKLESSALPEGEVEGSDIRLQYTVPSDRQTEAKTIARGLREGWLAAGAADVKVDDEVVPVQRPEVAVAKAVAAQPTLFDQLVAYWGARAIPVDESRRGRLGTRLEQIEEVGAGAKHAGGTLKHHRLSLRGMGTIRRPLVVDLESTPGPLVAVTGPNGAGKCLPASALVYTPSGAISIEQAVEARTPSVIGPCGQAIQAVPVSDWIDCGDHPILRVVTERGWTLDVADTHPVLTSRGWLRAEEIVPGDHVAFARTLPMEGDLSVTDDEVRLAGYLIGDGVMTEASNAILCASLPWKVEAFEAALRAVFPDAGVSVAHEKVELRRGARNEQKNRAFAEAVAAQGHSIRTYLTGVTSDNTSRFLHGGAGLSVETLDRMRADGIDVASFEAHFEGHLCLRRWAESKGIFGHRAPGKTLGSFARVPTAQVPLLIGALWFTDGYVSKDTREVSYTTASERLSTEIRDLLLRIGVLSTRRVKYVKGRPYFTISIPSVSKKRFADTVPVGGPKGELLRAVREARDEDTNVDGLPFDVWSAHPLRGHITAWLTHRRGMSRATFRSMGGPAEVANQPYWWVPIERVDSVGIRRCYDLTVDTAEHAYLTNGGAVVHNSTLLEILGVGSVHRTTPTRGTLASLACEADAMVEHVVENGARYTIRHAINGITGKGEVSVLDAAGAPVLSSTKVTEFDRWVARTMPALSVTLASTFAAQGSTGILGMTAGERKAVLLRVLGVEMLEAKAEAARKRASAAKQAHEVASARLRDERARTKNVADAEADLAKWQDDLRQATEAEEVAARAVEDARQAAAAHAELVRTRKDAEERKAAAKRAMDTAAAEEALLRTRLTNNRALLEGAEAIRAAVARLEAMGAEEAAAREAFTVADGARRDALHRCELAARDERDALGRRDVALQRVARARKRLADKPAIEQAAARVQELQATFPALEAACREASEAFERVRGEAIVGAEERIRDLRAALSDIAFPETKPGIVPELVARAAIQADDAAVERAAEHPAHLRHASAALDRAVKAAGDAKMEAAKLGALAARLGEMTEAEKEIEDAVQAEATAQGEIDAASARLEAAGAERATLEAAVAAASERINALGGERARLEPLAKRAAPLAQAEARVSELEIALEGASAATIERVAAHDAIDLRVLPAHDPGAVAQAEARRGELAVVVSTRRSGVALRERAMEEARAGAARCAALETEIAAHADDLADWTLLGESLGRDGLQAVRITAASPRLTTLVNDLLHTCHGPRFTVRVEASRLSADAKRELEGLEILVLDTKEGREAEGATFSGGEKAFLNEALSLALTMIACQEAGTEGSTLVRDETSAALDVAMGRAYVAMLRRAAGLVGAHRVLFVSHTPELVELADGRIELGAVA